MASKIASGIYTATAYNVWTDLFRSKKTQKDEISLKIGLSINYGGRIEDLPMKIKTFGNSLHLANKIGDILQDSFLQDLTELELKKILTGGDVAHPLNNKKSFIACVDVLTFNNFDYNECVGIFESGQLRLQAPEKYVDESIEEDDVPFGEPKQAERPFSIDFTKLLKNTKPTEKIGQRHEPLGEAPF